MSPKRARVILVLVNGRDRIISLQDARERIADGIATPAGHKDGMPCIQECRMAVKRDRVALHWVKDRGVTGGRYGMSFEPNGHSAQMMLVRQ